MFILFHFLRNSFWYITFRIASITIITISFLNNMKRWKNSHNYWKNFTFKTHIFPCIYIGNNIIILWYCVLHNIHINSFLHLKVFLSQIVVKDLEKPWILWFNTSFVWGPCFVSEAYFKLHFFICIHISSTKNAQNNNKLMEGKSVHKSIYYFRE